MAESSTTEHENITFETGYDELKDIVARLDSNQGPTDYESAALTN